MARPIWLWLGAVGASACSLEPATFDAFGGTGAPVDEPEADGSSTTDDGAEPADASSEDGTSGSAASDDTAAGSDDDDAGEGPDGADGSDTAADDASTTDDGAAVPGCGDGIVDEGEECDDGDALAGDGCSHHCAVETAPPKRVFITSVTFTGAMGGLVGADAQCQSLAEAAGLPGTFLAWLADGAQAPAWRFTHAEVPYILVDGTPIAENWLDLVDGTLAEPIDVTESGGPAPVGNHTCGQTAVWSNVTFDGGIASTAAHCAGWTDINAIQSHSGRYDLAGADWSASCFGGGAVCLWSAPIYCFEQ